MLQSAGHDLSLCEGKMAAKEKMVSRINRIEKENRELKEKLSKYESEELKSDMPDSVVWAMYLASRRSRERFKGYVKSRNQKIKDLEAEVASLKVKDQNSIRIIENTSDSLSEAKEEILGLKEEVEFLEEECAQFRLERNAALDMLEHEFCKSETMNALMDANAKLETRVLELEI